MKKGKYISRFPGEKCEKCKKGYLERIIVPPTGAESIFCFVTLGLGGDGGSQYFKCSNCHKEYSNSYYDFQAEPDKPMTWEERKRTIILLIMFSCAGIFSLFAAAFFGLLLGWFIS